MSVTVQILHGDFVMARIIYSPGFFVEISVEKSFQTKEPPYGPLRPKESTQTDSWPEALDRYFNEVIFEARNDLLPNEPPRTGSAREHRTLFLTAARVLEKNLATHGFRFRVSFG
jgi:hypothetical protein